MSEMPDRLRLLTVVAWAVLLAPSANAQGGDDITAEYTSVTNDMLARNASSLPAGWYTSGTVNLTDTVSIARRF